MFSSTMRLPSSLMVEYFPTLAKKAGPLAAALAQKVGWKFSAPPDSKSRSSQCFENIQNNFEMRCLESGRLDAEKMLDAEKILDAE